MQIMPFIECSCTNAIWNVHQTIFLAEKKKMKIEQIEILFLYF